MPGPPPDEAQARIAYYQERRKLGAYLNNPLYFYPGAATVPQSFTGNLIAYGGGNGPGAKIINGIGPAIPAPPPCDEPIITSLIINAAAPDILNMDVEYNVLPGDIYFVFNVPTGQVLYPQSVTPIAGGVQVEFDMTSPPADGGSWTFKIIRADDEACFAIRSGVYVTAAAGCALEVTDLSSPTGFPVSPPGPPGFPFGSFFGIEVTGSGFTTGPLAVTLINNFPPNNTIVASAVNVIDDNNLTFDFTGDGTSGLYAVRVTLISDPTCFAEIGTNPFTEPVVALQFF
jgi:hypothetical protein